MYGLINKALRDMVLDNYDEETWQQILEKSGVPDDSFLTMRSYDDGITYDLAGAASEVLGAPVEKCLELFGEYWLTEAAPNSYGKLLDAAGETVFEFLENLNVMHDRITSTFIDYSPPQFFVERRSDKEALVHYKSVREGLTPFVVGLFKGMGKRFNLDIKITDIQRQDVESGEHTSFLVNIE